MKKTLVALAALAATGAFAQVSLTGSYGMSYQKDNAGTTGFATTDGGVTFAASEDLGGGLKASASLGMDLQGRAQKTPGSTDASLSLAGGFGTVLVGTIEAGNGLLGRGAAGAPVSLPNGADDGKILAAASNVDIVKFTLPAMSGLTLAASYTDAAGAGGSAAASGKSAGVSAAYAAGALSIGADYTMYQGGAVAAKAAVPAEVDGDGVITSLGTVAVAAAAGNDYRARVSASYDLGVAKVGFGYETKVKTDDSKTNGYVVGVSAPLGAVTVGAMYARNTGTDAALTGVGVDYALSKRTVLNGSAGFYSNSTAKDQYRVRVLHSF
ncbi:MAG: hypothetical protein RLZZ591_1249 [Pseudomonadota bacterium]